VAISFVSPSYRAASSDLTIAISPLGLVELADEEFEVHGPRLNRYASQWAFYLGHHWSYKREIGEPQITFNWCKAFSDFMTNFALTNGVNFQSPHATEAVIPELLRTVWEEHQPFGKEATMWEAMQQGSVSGDCFTKVAFEDEYADPAGNLHPAKIRILPLNSAFCFPEYHPHDMSRMIRFKMKYRFWGTALEGTRQVFSFTELWTEDAMQAFINDELVESQDNPLGMIPFVHISNTKVPSSPWGLSDIGDITDLNRQYNETATLIADIINYYASPTTIIIGAKANNLERGPKKVWAIPNEKAKIQNLELNSQIEGPLQYLETLKEKMHELVGIPVNALGQPQEISNTSGVALSLQYLPLMQKFHQKITQYQAGFVMLNELIIRTAALYMPEMLQVDPSRDAPLEDGQLAVLDPADPLTYRNTVVFASPLPIDKLIALNEIQMEMALGLESKRGALKKLGEAYPAEKLEELLNELHQDALEQGALDLLNSQIMVLVSMMTGLPPGGPDAGGSTQDQAAPGVTSAGGPGVNTASGVAPPPTIGSDPGVKSLMENLTTIAAGTKQIQVRNPLKDPED
jgi:Phage portal protein, SPP1 Gp6-like